MVELDLGVPSMLANSVAGGGASTRAKKRPRDVKPRRRFNTDAWLFGAPDERSSEERRRRKDSRDNGEAAATAKEEEVSPTVPEEEEASSLREEYAPPPPLLLFFDAPPRRFCSPAARRSFVWMRASWCCSCAGNEGYIARTVFQVRTDTRTGFNDVSSCSSSTSASEGCKRSGGGMVLSFGSVVASSVEVVVGTAFNNGRVRPINDVRLLA